MKNRIVYPVRNLAMALQRLRGSVKISNGMYILSLVAGVFMGAMPVYAVTVGQDVTLVTLNGVSNVTILANSAFDTLTVNGSGFTFTMSGSQIVNLRDSDAQILLSNVSGETQSCGNNSELNLYASKAATHEVEIKGFACSGGGGGGSSATPSTTTTTSTVTTTTSSAATTPSTTTTSTGTTATAPAPTTTLEPVAASPYVSGAPPPAVPLGQAPVVQYSMTLNVTRGLGVGSTGEDVRSLQEALATMPDVYPEGLVTGRYGALTKAAVGRFQMKYGVVSSESDTGYGYVGPKTRTKLQEVFSGSMYMPSPMPSAPSAAPLSGVITQTLSLGDSGDDVIQLQAYLARDPELYPEAKVTGYYGPLTVAAVKRFQARHGITQVGRVGPQTMAKLNELIGSGGSMMQQMPSSSTSEEAALQSQIQQLQNMVNSLQSQIQSAQ